MEAILVTLTARTSEKGSKATKKVSVGAGGVEALIAAPLHADLDLANGLTEEGATLAAKALNLWELVGGTLRQGDTEVIEAAAAIAALARAMTAETEAKSDSHALVIVLKIVPTVDDPLNSKILAMPLVGI